MVGHVVYKYHGDRYPVTHFDARSHDHSRIGPEPYPTAFQVRSALSWFVGKHTDVTLDL